MAVCRQRRLARRARCAGPLFVKYNLVLRSLGSPENAYFAKQLAEMCDGNQYVTTIHVINSAIVKLGKVIKAQSVYRGVLGRVLPSSFWT